MPNEAACSRRRRHVLTLAGAGLATALAGCATDSAAPTATPPEATVTIRLENRDAVDRAYEVVVTQGTSLRDSFSGVLPPEQSVEMIATVRATSEQHDFMIDTDGGQRGRTWDPTECGEFLVDAVIENGEPRFEAGCRTASPTES